MRVSIELSIESVKGLREDLCVAQSALGHYGSLDDSAGIRERLQEILDQLDLFRPLGPDGKHGDRHTRYCGCDLPERLYDVSWTYPDPTPEQEIDIVDRIISGLPMEYLKPANPEGNAVYVKPAPDKLYDVASLHPQEITPKPDLTTQALIEAANTWRRIPDFDNYEVNPLGILRNRWTRRVLEVDEQGDEKYVEMHDKEGFPHIINVLYVLETIYNK